MVDSIKTERKNILFAPVFFNGLVLLLSEILDLECLNIRTKIHTFTKVYIVESKNELVRSQLLDGKEVRIPASVE